MLFNSCLTEFFIVHVSNVYKFLPLCRNKKIFKLWFRIKKTACSEGNFRLKTFLKSMKNTFCIDCSTFLFQSCLQSLTSVHLFVLCNPVHQHYMYLLVQYKKISISVCISLYICARHWRQSQNCFAVYSLDKGTVRPWNMFFCPAVGQCKKKTKTFFSCVLVIFYHLNR